MSVFSRFLGAAAVGASVLLGPVIPSASAAPCPDVEVVFARGTFEPPGVGDTGQAFASSLLGEKLKILCHRACNGSDEQLATFKRFRSP
jgi:hypothetical protein